MGSIFEHFIEFNWCLVNQMCSFSYMKNVLQNWKYMKIHTQTMYKYNRNKTRTYFLNMIGLFLSISRQKVRNWDWKLAQNCKHSSLSNHSVMNWNGLLTRLIISYIFLFLFFTFINIFFCYFNLGCENEDIQIKFSMNCDSISLSNTVTRSH